MQPIFCKTKITWVFGLVSLSLITPARSEFIYGSRAQGMAGAFVALSDDASALYWNPAGIALIPNRWSVTIDSGRDYDFSDKATSLINALTLNNPRGSFDSARLIAHLNKLNDLQWLTRGGDRFGLAITGNHLGFSITGYDVFFVQPGVDTVNLNPDSAAPDYIGNNSTSLRFSGFEIKEYSISYAWPSEDQSMSIGVSAKYTDITAFDGQTGFWDLESYESKDLLELVSKQNSFDDDFWNFDAGLIFGRGANRLGLVGKNLLNREIDLDDEDQFKVKPFYRMGYLFMPSDQFHFTIDYNLTPLNDPTGEKFDGKEIALGFESAFGKNRAFLIRGGSAFDQKGDTPLLFSGGVGLLFQNISIDAAYTTDQDRDTERLWLSVHIFFK